MCNLTVTCGYFRWGPPTRAAGAGRSGRGDLPHFRVMRITVLAGGVGAARFLRGLRRAAPEAEITVIGNTGDDITLFGLRVCPDLDTVMYTLGGGINEDQGWGRRRGGQPLTHAPARSLSSCLH